MVREASPASWRFAIDSTGGQVHLVWRKGRALVRVLQTKAEANGRLACEMWAFSTWALRGS